MGARRNPGSRLFNSLLWRASKPHVFLHMRFQSTAMFASERADLKTNWDHRWASYTPKRKASPSHQTAARRLTTQLWPPTRPPLPHITFQRVSEQHGLLNLGRRIAPNGNLAIVNGMQSLGLMKKSLFERILSYSHEHYLRYTNKKNPIAKGAIIYLYNSYPPLKVI